MRGAAAIKYFGVDDKSLQVWAAATTFADVALRTMRAQILKKRLRRSKLENGGTKFNPIN